MSERRKKFESSEGTAAMDMAAIKNIEAEGAEAVGAKLVCTSTNGAIL